MSTDITIAYFTCRVDPKIEWFFRSLNREIKGDWSKVRILIIDYWIQYKGDERYEDFKKHWNIYPGCRVEHISPKPCPLQGSHRVTAKEYFAASNARNTAFLHCLTPYIVCIDDLTVVKEGWFSTIQWARDRNFVIYGSYAKVKNLKCTEDGSYTYTDHPAGLDSRYGNPHITNNFATKVAGSWLFGCSFGLPLSLAMKADGFDETCDGQGAEDYDFGIRIGRLTTDIYYSRVMFTFEDEDLHFAPGNIKFIRESKKLTSESKMPEYEGIQSDHAMLQRVLKSDHLPFTPNNLKSYICPSFIGMKDWRDGVSLSDV